MKRSADSRRMTGKKEFNKGELSRMRHEIEMIINKAPPCPDPVSGGCIGNHCILCAAGNLRVMLRSEA